MNRIKIKLDSPEKATSFVNLCSKYNNDINIYDGSVVIDAKSIIGVFGIENGKSVEVEMIGVNLEEIKDFSINIIEYK